jgi:hypothetical protein
LLSGDCPHTARSASQGLRYAGPPSAKVGNVHAVSQYHFAPSFDKTMQITASVSGALAHPPDFLRL